ncbi:hypothetical protein DICVIV_02538 [Dictyocaulus viviparus]|uniref:FHOD1 N-terminal GTPase-binding domain-containing protein n=1 Tax=Dictyocaulus viviparus TaxID=29172 RepID=A0A0D8Y5K7_DICVI|nr:hypothetical protein DICVIV_02538 [Dictyocaulus viviparus]
MSIGTKFFSSPISFSRSIFPSRLFSLDNEKSYCDCLSNDNYTAATDRYASYGIAVDVLAIDFWIVKILRDTVGHFTSGNKETSIKIYIRFKLRNQLDELFFPRPSRRQFDSLAFATLFWNDSLTSGHISYTSRRCSAYHYDFLNAYFERFKQFSMMRMFLSIENRTWKYEKENQEAFDMAFISTVGDATSLAMSDCTTYNCRVQYVDDSDPFASTSNAFLEPMRPVTFSFRIHETIADQLPEVIRTLRAPHKNMDEDFYYSIKLKK